MNQITTGRQDVREMRHGPYSGDEPDESGTPSGRRAHLPGRVVAWTLVGTDGGTITTTVQRRVLLVAILATFVAFLDGTVVTVALPAIGRELGGGGEAL